MTSPSRGDGQDRRRPASARAGTRRRRRRVRHRRASIASAADFVYATAPAASGLGVDPGQPLEGDPEQRDVERRGAPSPPAGSNGSNASPAGGQERPAGRASTGRTGPRRRAPARRASNRAREVVRGRRRARPRRASSRPSSRRATPSSPRPRTRRWVGRTVSGSRDRVEEQRQEVVERRVLLARAASSAARRGSAAPSRSGGGRRRSSRARRAATASSGATIGRGVAVGRDRPQPMPDAVVVEDVEVGGAGAVSSSRIGRPTPAGSSYSADDRARVDAGRAQQLVAVLLGPGHRPLVRQHAGLRTEGLEAEPGEEPALDRARRPCRARDRPARRHRSTGAGPCGACRPSARPRASGPPAGSDRPARRRAPRAGRSRRTTLAGWRASRRSCSAGIDDVVRRRDDEARGRRWSHGS